MELEIEAGGRALLWSLTHLKNLENMNMKSERVVKYGWNSLIFNITLRIIIDNIWAAKVPFGLMSFMDEPTEYHTDDIVRDGEYDFAHQLDRIWCNGIGTDQRKLKYYGGT